MIIAPSLLAANFGKFAAETLRAHRSGADWLHLDIMDGHFVPNLSFGPQAVRAIRKLTAMPFDVHLMCSRPEILVEPFCEAGADSITVHVELGDRVDQLLWKIRSLGLNAGLAVNPSTSVSTAEPFLKRVDMLLIMTVNPGFGGQTFISEMLPKIQQAALWRRDRNLKYRLEVDGGINLSNAAECARAGADTFVCGTSLFGQRQMKRAVTGLRKSMEAATRQSPAAA